jgi:hypothetical protein
VTGVSRRASLNDGRGGTLLGTTVRLLDVRNSSATAARVMVSSTKSTDRAKHGRHHRQDGPKQTLSTTHGSTYITSSESMPDFPRLRHESKH